MSVLTSRATVGFLRWRPHGRRPADAAERDAVDVLPGADGGRIASAAVELEQAADVDGGTSSVEQHDGAAGARQQAERTCRSQGLCLVQVLDRDAERAAVPEVCPITSAR
jgi:hypothetical protein